MKIIELIKQFIFSKGVKRFLWNTLNAFIALVITFVTTISAWWAVPLMGLLNWITKEINNNHLSKRQVIGY